MSRSYLMWVPPLCGSAGVRALYKLAQELQAHGYTVRLWSWGEERQPGFEYAESVTPQMREEDIVVYPEIVKGNPLRIRNVVRWVLFFPGQLGGEKSFHPSEKVFSWGYYFPNAPQLVPNLIDSSLFFDAGLPRTQDCVFAGKSKRTDDPALKGLTEITAEWPKTRKELAHLLQTTDTLYTWDAHTMLADEAYDCGAKVKIVTEDGYRDFTPGKRPSPELWNQQLEFFISTSQAMNYTGELQTIPAEDKAKTHTLAIKLAVFSFFAAFLPLHFLRRGVKRYREKLRRLGWQKS